MGILQVRGHRQIPCFLDTTHGRVNGAHRCVAFRRAGYISHRIRQNDLGLRHAYPLHRQRCAHSHLKRLGIRISHILRGANHDTARNEGDTFTGIKHFCQIIDRSVRIRPPHAFDKGRNRIIMVVPGLIVFHHTLLDAFARHLQRYVDFSVRGPRRGHDPQLYGIQRMPGIPSRHIGKEIHGVLIYLRVVGAHPLLPVIDSPPQKLLYILPGQRL